MPTLSVQTPAFTFAADQRIDLAQIGWPGYRSMLQVRGGRPRPKLLYLDGDLLLVSPSYTHEYAGKRLGLLVSEVAVGLGIVFLPAGSTTYRRRKKMAGAEPDESFYFAHAHHIHGKKEISLRTDPPPDLVIEVVHTHHADTAIEIYRRFGVPELWIWEDSALRILALQPDGSYTDISTSLSLAPLTASDVTFWINREDDDNLALSWLRELRQWVQDVLLPRRTQQTR